MDHTDSLIELAFSVMRMLRRKMTCIAQEDKDANWLQLHTLAYISSHEGVTMKELAKELQVAPPSATSFVNRLVKLKWVERMMDPKNRKLVRLKVTELGKETIGRKLDEKKKYFGGILSVLSYQDRSDLERIFTRLLDSHYRST